MTKFWLALISLLGAGCVSSGGLFPIEYEFIDHPDERKVEVRYRNNLTRTVCLLPEFWPNQAGKINQASQEVFLVVENERFAIEEFNTGYCPDCALRVEPGEEVVASIGYNLFALPENFVEKEKHLEFQPKAYHCGRWDDHRR